MSFDNSDALWKTWEQINEITSERTVLLYGRSEDWVHKTINRIKKPIAGIIDREKRFHGTSFYDLPIMPIEDVDDEQKNCYFVITAGEYEGIVAILEDNGYRKGDNFCCCPEFRDYKILDTFRTHDEQIVVSCSDYNDLSRARSSRAGGGLYIYETKLCKYEKVLTGSFRQLVQVNDRIYVVDYVSKKIMIVDLDLSVIESYDIDAPNYCGIAYSKTKDLIILTNAAQDTVSLHKPDSFELVDRCSYSDRVSSERTSIHHINDVTCDGDTVYVSYFSHSGNWKKGVFDGGVSQIDLNRIHEPPIQIINNLWKPHSPDIIDGTIHVLDSMRGGLYGDGMGSFASFTGFARGLCYNRGYYYIGQSEDMYISKRFAHGHSIMLNAGFYMYEKKSNVCRFHAMMDIMNVHDLLVIDKG
jgi:hypothetical protein